MFTQHCTISYNKLELVLKPTTLSANKLKKDTDHLSENMHQLQQTMLQRRKLSIVFKRTFFRSLIENKKKKKLKFNFCLKECCFSMWAALSHLNICTKKYYTLKLVSFIKVIELF